MNELQIVSYDGVEVVDSRDIAIMVERDHKELLKTIRLYCDYLNQGEVPPVDFFIESTYTGGNGQERPNYLITKKGCDLIANKMIGKKGVLFTAAYVQAFERMREAVQNPTPPPMTPAQLLAAQAKVLVDMEQRMDQMQGQTRALEAKVETAIRAFSRPDKDHWKEDMDKAIKEVCELYGSSIIKLKGQLYAELEQKANCNINSRLAALRRRSKKSGMRCADAMALTKLDAIAADKKLRAIFEGIVRSWQATATPVVVSPEVEVEGEACHEE